jgi:dihydrodipicolinate synthase/N-acetylneuraminate lyase
MLKGVFPAIITPFLEDESLDEEGLKKNIEYLNNTGIAGIVPCGTTGESATLTFEEHKRVVEIAVESSKVPVIAGTGSNNTREALELTRHAAKAGADAALLITPYYNKPKIGNGTHTALAKHVDAHFVTCTNLRLNIIFHLKPLNVADLQLEDAVLLPGSIALQDPEDSGAGAIITNIVGDGKSHLLNTSG